MNSCERGLAIGLGLFSVISIASLVVPIYRSWLVGLIALGASVLVSIILGFVFRPKLMDAASAADSLGLKERMTTALECIDNDDDMSQIVVRDAAGFANTVNVKKAFRFNIPRDIMLLFLCLFLTSFVPMFFNTSAKEKAIENHEIEELKKEADERLEQKVGEIVNAAIPDELKEEAANLLEEAKQELKSDHTKESIKKTEERFGKKLEQQVKETLKKEVKNDIKQALDDIKNNKMSAEEAAELVNNLKEMAESLSAEDIAELGKEIAELLQDPELVEALKEAQESGNLQNVIQEALNSGAISPSDLEAAMQMAQQVAQAAHLSQSSSAQSGQSSGNPSSLSPGQQGQQAQNGQGSQGNQSGQGQGNNGQGQNGQNGQSQGQGQNGQGQGQGQGQGGSAGGSGSGSGSGGGWNMGSFIGQEKKNPASGGDTVTIPTYKNEYLTGKYGSSGASSYEEADQFLAVEGGSEEYEKVIAEYTQKAYETFSAEGIPDALQDIIKNYFKEISSGVDTGTDFQED